MFPGAQRMNRGNHEVPALVQACRANNVSDLVIVHETRGQPGTPVLRLLISSNLALSLGVLVGSSSRDPCCGSRVKAVMCTSADGLVVCHLPFGPTAYFTLYNVVMRHDVPDIGTMSEAFPHLIFHNFTSQLGQRVSTSGPAPPSF